MHKFVWSVLLCWSLWARAGEPIRGEVQSTRGLTCPTYLFTASAHPRKLILQILGTGVYSNARAESMTAPLKDLSGNGDVAVLTYDKPGLTAEGFDAATFDRHMQSDLIECADKALDWALTQAPFAGRDSAPPILIRGHSEGAQIAIQLYARVLLKRPSIEMLVLSGTPIEKWRPMIGYELHEAGEAFTQAYWQAYATCDNDYLRSISEVPCAYLRDILDAPGDDMQIRRLADLHAPATFEIFHGLQDTNVDPLPVWQMGAELAERAESGGASLNWIGHFNPGPHSLGEDGQRELNLIIESWVR